MNQPLRIGVVAALIAAPAASSAPLLAQASARSVPETYAITNARIVTGNGPTIERGTIVVRKGLIAAVGANTAAPPEARIVDGTGLTVYPGLIDAFGSLGISAPPAPAAGAGESQQPADFDHPYGITPEVLAVDLIKVDATTFEGPRTAGITTALSAPTAGFLTGRAALMDLSDENLADAVLESPAAMTMQFGSGGRGGGGGGRGYPGSLMGIFAAFRQEMLDARRYGEWKALYAQNPRGVQRPVMNAGFEALQPVLRGEMPIIFEANSAREILRAIDLAKEFKLKAVIAGGAEADQCTKELAAANIPVLLSLDFPHVTQAPAPGAPPEPLRTLEARVNAPKVAGKLSAAGVRFAFESGGITNWSDFLGNASKAVAAGLSQDQAVRALTMAPAQIFGVAEQTGSIEPGKIANLTVASGDLFERGTKVAEVFVDGRMITPSAPAPAGGGRGRGGRGGNP